MDEMEERIDPVPEYKEPKIAFISGHIDLSHETFIREYKTHLDTAIANGDDFILSNAGGADSMALEYLRSQNVCPSRITIYVHTPPSARQNPRRAGQLRTGPAKLEHYRKEGFGMMVVDGGHTERDAEMTEDSDYDILWVRSEEETKALYGRKYRPGRISGTQKNKDRRLGAKSSENS